MIIININQISALVVRQVLEGFYVGRKSSNRVPTRIFTEASRESESNNLNVIHYVNGYVMSAKASITHYISRDCHMSLGGAK